MYTGVASPLPNPAPGRGGTVKETPPPPGPGRLRLPSLPQSETGAESCLCEWTKR